MDVPILIIGFNRPEETTRLIARLIRAQAMSVYVAIDGPRDGNDSDELQCSIVRSIVDSAPWPGSVKKNYRFANLGCRRGVSDAITWFFSYESEGIILEDDCLPDETFFEYCSQLLERFREDFRIGMIAGSNFFPDNRGGSSSYTFSRYPHIWGWATWKRAWAHYDQDLESWKKPHALEVLESVSGGSRSFVRFWENVLDSVLSKKVDTWDYIWSYSFWKAGFLSVTPSTNLITNIGFHHTATHTRAMPLGRDFRPEGNHLQFPLVHPAEIKPDLRLEKLTRALAMGVHGRLFRTALRLLWLFRPKNRDNSTHI